MFNPLYGQTDKTPKDIEEVVIAYGSDEKAIQLLRQVNKKYDKNSPQSLDSYEFTSYQKISLDVDKDSISDYREFLNRRKDSLIAVKSNPKETADKDEKKKKEDEIKFIDIAKESQLFLWERAQKFLYSKKYGDKVILLDNRMSGLKEPFYELLTLRTNLYKIPKEIRPANFHLYYYHLKKNIDYKGRENYVIRFVERNSKNLQKKRKYNGYIYIDKETLGITKIESNSKEENKGNLSSEWVYRNGKWFLDNEQFKIHFATQQFDIDKIKTDDGKDKKRKKEFSNFIYFNSKYFDIKTPSDASEKDFKGYTFSVKNANGNLIDKYRKDTLSLRERNTYVKIDSLGKEFKIDQKTTIISALLRGNLRTGYIDWDITEIFGLNNFEGLRLGGAGRLNERFSKIFSPNAYFAYGFKDKKWKYGVGLDINTSQNITSIIKLSYADDVYSSGRFNQNFWNTKMNLLNTGVGIHNNRFFTHKTFKIGYERDLSNSLTSAITLKNSHLKSGFDYQYKQEDDTYNDNSILLSFKYSPNSKNIMTPMGKYTYRHGYPELFLNYEKGIKTLGGKYDYHRIDALFTHQFKGRLGMTDIKLYGGYLIGDTPIYNAFEMGGLKDIHNPSSFSSRLSLSTYLGFATMESGMYYNDKFVAYHFSQRLPFNIRAGKGLSNFDLIYKGEIGDFENKDIHHFDFSPLDHLYQEVGIEYNNILNTTLNLGFFYRIGHYHQPHFKDNFAVQLKLKVLDF